MSCLYNHNVCKAAFVSILKTQFPHLFNWGHSIGTDGSHKKTRRVIQAKKLNMAQHLSDRCAMSSGETMCWPIKCVQARILVDFCATWTSSFCCLPCKRSVTQTGLPGFVLHVSSSFQPRADFRSEQPLTVRNVLQTDSIQSRICVK